MKTGLAAVVALLALAYAGPVKTHTAYRSEDLIVKACVGFECLKYWHHRRFTYVTWTRGGHCWYYGPLRVVMFE